MAEHFFEHMLISLAFSSDKLKDINGQEFYPNAMQIDARHWAHVRRNRYFIGMTQPWVIQPAEPLPWDPAWMFNAHVPNLIMMP